MSLSRRLLPAACVVAALSLPALPADALGAGKTVSACASKSGTLRLAKKCKKGERKYKLVTSSTRGPAGPAGAAGAQGAKGDPGPKGDAGVQGATGTAKASSCTPGSVVTGVTAAGDLTCEALPAYSAGSGLGLAGGVFSLSPPITLESSAGQPPLTATNTATTGSVPGLVGETNSTSHGVGATGGATGVRGVVTPTTPGGYSAGVRGINNGTSGTGIGVIGYQAGSGWGVYGETPSGFGVYGLTTNNAASSVGVRGETFSTAGTAVEAKYSGAGDGEALQLDNGKLTVAGVNKAAVRFTPVVLCGPGNAFFAIDHPFLNGDAAALPLLTHVDTSPASLTAAPDLALVYNASGGVAGCTADRWLIWNESGAAIPAGTQVDLLVING